MMAINPMEYCKNCKYSKRIATRHHWTFYCHHGLTGGSKQCIQRYYIIDIEKQKENEQRRKNNEVNKMVKRKKTEKVEVGYRFKGKVELVEKEPRKTFDNDESNAEPEKESWQYHMVIKPLDKKTVELVSGSKTERLHNYIKISDTTTDTEIAEGSTLDTFISEVELCLPETKEMETHLEVMQSLEGISFEFVNKKVGKSYGNFEARTAFVPVSVIED